MRIEKTVFISYRRNDSLDLAKDIYEHLRKKGYDVFFDKESLPSGDFLQTLIKEIKKRAHFLLILAPLTLKPRAESEDVLRIEIETAIDNKRNIVPIFHKNFDFGSPPLAQYLTGKLAVLPKYHGINFYDDYPEAALNQLCSNRFLERSLKEIMPPPPAKELTVQEWVEKGDNIKIITTNRDTPKQQVMKALYEQIQAYNEALRINPECAEAYYKRGLVLRKLGDNKNAIADFDKATALKRDYAEAYYNCGIAWRAKGNLEKAINHFTKAIKHKDDYTEAYTHRGHAWQADGDLEKAIEDFTKAIKHSKSTDKEIYRYRADALKANCNIEEAKKDFDKYDKLGGRRGKKEWNTDG